MTDAIVNVMVEVLCILAIATKEVNQRRASELIPGNRYILPAYCSLETFLKRLVGRTDIEDALLRLEEVTLQEARMAAAESLRAIYGVGSNVQDMLKAMEDRMRGMEGMLQGRLKGIDDRVKDKAANSAQPLLWIITLIVYIHLDAEEAGPQMSNDLDAGAAEGLTTAHGIDDKVQPLQRVHDTRQGVCNRAIDLDEERNTVPDTGSRVIDGQPVILNRSFMPTLSV